EKLGAALLRQLCVQVPVAREAQLVIGGNAVGSGGNLTRLMALEAGFPVSTPALTVDMQCASALAALSLAWGQIASGQLDLVLAGGVESSSMQPRRVYQPWDARYTPEGYMTAQFSPDTDSPRTMLEGAERTAQVYGVSREELDRWAVRSHRKAAEAWEEGRLEPWVVSLFGSTRDESIRPRMNGRLARRMPTLFTREETEILLTPEEAKLAGDGTPTLTAANACLTQDGAAFPGAGLRRKTGGVAPGRKAGAPSGPDPPLHGGRGGSPVQSPGSPGSGGKAAGRNRPAGGGHR
ncbi:beta-ketoacyl synthase N-terminal-like domain-containing protein, partial [Acidaminococcus fermentans]|uniref:thiolase family protein n=1 Tax=Acidaminococcus fermentans TaxID=905 RepID=UPI00242E64D0